MSTSFPSVPRHVRWYLAAAAGFVLLVLVSFVAAVRRPTILVRLPPGIAQGGASIRANGRDHPLECSGAICSLYGGLPGAMCSVTLRESSGGALSFACDYCMRGDELELSVTAGRMQCTHAYDR